MGNTGCGKSTMLVSIIEGPGALAQTTIQKDLKAAKGKKKKPMRVIARRQEPAEGDSRGHFKIGHNSASSETFLPNFQAMPEKQITFIDIAGLKDTGGDLVDTLNCIINKIVFSFCKEIKLLIPMTHQQITEQRGNLVRDQIKLIQGVCEANLHLIQKSILPIITKMKPTADENDLDYIKSVVHGQLQCTIAT